MQNQGNKSPMSNLSSNDFEFLNKLGKGSFGIVHKVKRKSNKAIYVLKQINISSMKSKMRGIALNEVKILKALENPYIVKYYDSFIERDQLNIVMEYCEGGDLAQHIKNHFGKPLSETKIWKFFIQMCIGLNYIHSKKILHRDIKSLNIFLTKDGDIRIGDLGVAKILADSVNFAHTMVGTPYYLSPEMCEEKPYNEKSDIWALGCVLYELCVQKHPFQAQSQGTLILKIIKGRYSPIPGTYSQELIEIVNLCLNKDYKKRPTASALLCKASVIDKAKSLNIPLHDLIRDKSKVKENEIIFQNKERAVAINISPAQKENEGEKLEKKAKSEDNKEGGKINIFFKNELPKAVIGEDLPNKNGGEIKNPLNKIIQGDLHKAPVAKPIEKVNENKGQKVEKPPNNLKHKDNQIGPEFIAKVAVDGKKANYFVVNGEKAVNLNKEKEIPVIKDERNVQRVRKGAPADLGRFAKIVGSQQKLVKKGNIEPIKIGRPSLQEEREAQKVRSPLENNGLSLKKLPNEYKDEITEDDINQVKNLPDLVVLSIQKGHKKEPVSASAKVDVFITKEVPKDLKKHVTVEKLKQMEEENIKKELLGIKAEIKKEKPKTKENTLIPQENVSAVRKESPEKNKEEEDTNDGEEGDLSNRNEEIQAQIQWEESEENNENNEVGNVEEEEKIDQERVVKDKLRQDQNPYPEVKWKISEEENYKANKHYANANAMSFKGNEAKEVKVWEEYEECEEKEETQENKQDEEINNNNEFEEEEEDGEDEDDEIEGQDIDEQGLKQIQQMDQETITKKLEKYIKKREKIIDMVKKITSSSYIKAIGDNTFAEIVNFIKLKLESDDVINEEDQDEIENFLQGKLNPHIQAQVVFNIYRLLGLQIELQKCEKEIDKYSAVFS